MTVTPTSLSCYSLLENNFQNLRSEIYDLTAIPTLEYFIIFHFPVSEKIFFSQIGQSIVLYILA